VIIELGQSTSREDRVPGLFATEPLLISTPMKMGRKSRIFSTDGVALIHVGFIHEILFRFQHQLSEKEFGHDWGFRPQGY